MSRIYVDRISPYQSGSVQVDGLSIDTGSLATKAELNAYTSSNDSTIATLATTGSNTFQGNQTFNVGDGAFALRANFNNSFFYTLGSSNTVGILKNDYSEATSMAQGTGFNTFNANSDITLTPNLNGLSGQGDDKPGIIAYSGSVAQDVISLPKKSWDSNGEVNFKTPIVTNQSLTAQSNLQANGNVVISGSGANKQWITDWPTNFNEKNITTFDGFTAGNGAVYNNNFQRITNYGSFGNNLEGLVTSFNDSGASNYYSSFWFGPNAAYWTMSPSGSGGQESLIKLQTDNGAATTTVTLQADTVDINGPVSLSQVLKLEAQDPLPGGSVGELAVSGSNLFYHNGTSWAQIN